MISLYNTAYTLTQLCLKKKLTTNIIDMFPSSMLSPHCSVLYHPPTVRELFNLLVDRYLR